MDETPKPVFIDDVLSSHKEWLESEGERGARADLRNAILQQADLHDANLERAEMSGVRLSVADLMRTNLKGAVLRGADLWMSDMKGALLEGADLRGANLSEVTNLSAEQLGLALTDEDTQLPTGL